MESICFIAIHVLLEKVSLDVLCNVLDPLAPITILRINSLYANRLFSSRNKSTLPKTPQKTKTAIETNRWNNTEIISNQSTIHGKCRFHS